MIKKNRAGHSKPAAHSRTGASRGGTKRIRRRFIPIRYRGYIAMLDVALKGGARNGIVASFETQIDLIQDIPMREEVLCFFRKQTVTVHDGVKGAHAGPAGIFLRAEPLPHIAPILLHEMLHLYHERCLPDGRFNRTVRRHFEHAVARRLYPKDSYMLCNVSEFFAMTACAVLYGRISRAPYTRRAVREQQPKYYKWLERQFGLPAIQHA